jgi:entericidin B
VKEARRRRRGLRQYVRASHRAHGRAAKCKPLQVQGAQADSAALAGAGTRVAQLAGAPRAQPLMEAQMRTLAMLIALSLTLLAGCNTIEGMGKDLERGGERLQYEADSAKRNMY